MKKALLGIGVLVTAVISGLVGFVIVQPGELTVSHTVEVDASPADVAAYAHDLRRVNEWSPWRDIDPNLTATYSEATSGVGAWYSWNGNDDVGEGKQTVAVSEDGKVVHDLHFIRPMEDHATSTLTWTGAEEKTTVTWSFHQEAGFGTKAANLAMDITGMLGNDYAKGMADLKPLVEAHAAERRKAAQLAEAEAQAKAEAEAAEPEGSAGL